jgi:tellurite resistance protein TehA-like permease
MVEQKHTLDAMTTLWLLPAISLIVASSTGGLLSTALKAQSMKFAILTTLFSLTMVIIGLSLALMMITVYLARLVISGPPEKLLVLSAFVALGPFGQGGYSLLINGQNLSEILPLNVSDTFPYGALGGQMIFLFCLCGAYILWSMGICWIIISFNSIFSVLKKEGGIPFSITYQGLIFPNAVFALLSVQLGNVLNSDVFRGFGAAWTGQNTRHHPFLDLLTVSDSCCLCSVAEYLCKNQPRSHRQVHICCARHCSSTSTLAT